MFWNWLRADQWSALGTVVSAFVAALNLVVVIVLVRYNRKTIDILERQSLDTQAQASVAVQTLYELNRERKLQNGRELMRADERLQDLNDRFVILKDEIDEALFSAANASPLKPDDWNEVTAVVIEFWPGGMEKIAELGQKLRAIDTDISFLSKSLDHQRMQNGMLHLKQLLSEAHQLVIEIHAGLMHEAAK